MNFLMVFALVLSGVASQEQSLSDATQKLLGLRNSLLNRLSPSSAFMRFKLDNSN